MAREKEDFRANMERLNELFPEKEMLTMLDVLPLFGLKDKRALKKRVHFTDGFVSKATLARTMCG